MNRRRHFGLGLSKTRVPVVVVTRSGVKLHSNFDFCRLGKHINYGEFFVSLNGSASGRSSGGTKFRPACEAGADWGERCAASGAFNGSSPTANLVSIIKEQGIS